MSDRTRTVRVHLEVVDHDHGHWCNRCLLATGLRVWVTLRHGSRMHMQTRLYCYECEGHDVTLAAPDDTRHC